MSSLPSGPWFGGWEVYPDLAEHVMQHLEGPGHVDEGDFEFALDLILDGVERLRDAAEHCRPASPASVRLADADSDPDVIADGAVPGMAILPPER